MSTKEKARGWLNNIFHSEIRSSKYYPEKDIWFFTFPIRFCEKGNNGYADILLQDKENLEEFIYLRVPFSFFRENREKLDMRSDEDFFDFHISAKPENWLECERSRGVSFKQFLQKTLT